MENPENMHINNAAATETIFKALTLFWRIFIFECILSKIISPSYEKSDLKIVSSDDELAVVIGHEVAHAVAKHSNERMSQQIAAQYGSQILSAALSEKSAMVQDIAGTVYGIGAQYGVMLPFSRTHELEADYMGLIFMAIAGYNPEVAVNFWQKMSAGSGGSIPEFMSTHPSDARRISEIKRILPEIMKYKTTKN